ncbi:hypothetical protein [Aeromonas salmonicida]
MIHFVSRNKLRNMRNIQLAGQLFPVKTVVGRSLLRHVSWLVQSYVVNALKNMK